MRPSPFDLALIAVVILLTVVGLAVEGVAAPHGHGLRCTYGVDSIHHRCATAP
jgi:hypothetical protein